MVTCLASGCGTFSMDNFANSTQPNNTMCFFCKDTFTIIYKLQNHTAVKHCGHSSKSVICEPIYYFSETLQCHLVVHSYA